MVKPGVVFCKSVQGGLQDEELLPVFAPWVCNLNEADIAGGNYRYSSKNKTKQKSQKSLGVSDYGCKDVCVARESQYNYC